MSNNAPQTPPARPHREPAQTVRTSRERSGPSKTPLVTLGTAVSLLVLLPGIALLLWGVIVQVAPTPLLVFTGEGSIDGGTPSAESVLAHSTAVFETGWVVFLVGVGLTAVTWAIVALDPRPTRPRSSSGRQAPRPGQEVAP